MSESIYKILKKCAWILFFVLLVLCLANIILSLTGNLFQKTLPFKHVNGKVIETTDDALNKLFKNKEITKIDTVAISQNVMEAKNFEENDESETSNLVLFRTESNHGIQINFDSDFESTDKDSVEITLKDTLTNISEHRFVQTNSEYNKMEILNIAGNFALLIFAFFNSFILLKYSSAKENVLIVFFILFLITPPPSLILDKQFLYVWTILLSPFWGILFYHFMVLKVDVEKKIKKLYIISTIIFLIGYILSLLFKEGFDFIHLWSAFWMFKGFLLLRKEYKKSRSIELRRLWGAFSGIGVSMISFILIFVIA
ncbi:MAG: hypothetical protein J7K29_04810, partial [Candidatus Cloacimonetes bacterium]|nr:hypothetical protein [Candidatus Cloacimonadota bacterium]